MGAKQKYSAKEVREAIYEAEGVIAHAAAILKCHARTVYRYAERYSTVEDALTEARQDLYAEAQGKLVDKMRSGDEKSQRWAIGRILETYGDHIDDGLDWTEKDRIEMSGGESPVRIKYDNNTPEPDQ